MLTLRILIMLCWKIHMHNSCNHEKFKIGSLVLKNNVLLAPMAGITNSSYRLIHKLAGAGLVFSEMISSNGLIRNGKKTLELTRHRDSEGPFAIQIFGDSPDVMGHAAQMCAESADMLDINMGCPVKKVIRSGAGSALMQNPKLAGAIMAAVRKATSLPLSIKIRSGWDAQHKNFAELGHIAVEEGIDAITLHPRTKSQGFGGKANWEDIRSLKQQVTIPVVGSGDIVTPEDALAMLETTTCNAVMIGRGSYGNPWLIKNIIAAQLGEALHIPERKERGRMALTHLELLREDMDDRRALLEMRKHLCWYARGLSGASEFRRHLIRTDDIGGVYLLVDSFFNLNHGDTTQVSPQDFNHE